MNFIKILFVLFMMISFGFGVALSFNKDSLNFTNFTKLFLLNNTKNNDTIIEISSLIDLPVDETPSLFQIDSLEGLENETFYKKAQVGDKLIIYTNNKKAILYRPSENKIIEVGAVNVVNQVIYTPTISPTPSDL